MKWRSSAALISESRWFSLVVSFWRPRPSVPPLTPRRSACRYPRATALCGKTRARFIGSSSTSPVRRPRRRRSVSNTGAAAGRSNDCPKTASRAGVTSAGWSWAIGTNTNGGPRTPRRSRAAMRLNSRFARSTRKSFRRSRTTRPRSASRSNFALRLTHRCRASRSSKPSRIPRSKIVRFVSRSPKRRARSSKSQRSTDRSSKWRKFHRRNSEPAFAPR